MTTVAIDPGVGGAMVVANRNKIVSYRIPTEENIGKLMELSSIKDATFVIEKIPYTSGFNRPAARIAKLFENVSFIRGVLRGREAKIVTVRPQEWQSIFQPLPKNYNDRKKEVWKQVSLIYKSCKITKKAADAYAILHWYFTQGLFND